jgi:AcrR family transcriptional regulator
MVTEPTTEPRPARRSGMRMSADERRHAVLAVALHEFAIGGLAGTSTDVIADRAGISQPYLFRLFGSKRDLFLATVNLAFDRVRSGFKQATEGLSGNDALVAMAIAYGDLISDRDLLLTQLHAYAACADLEVRAVVRGLYAELIDFIKEATGVDEEELRKFVACGMLCNVVAALGIEEYEALGLPMPEWPLEPDLRTA